MNQETSVKNKKLKEIKIIEAWCKGCGICVDACPKNVLVMDQLTVKVARAEDCIVCGRCEIVCPDFCIEVIPDKSGSGKD